MASTSDMPVPGAYESAAGPHTRAYLPRCHALHMHVPENNAPFKTVNMHFHLALVL